jgi:large subunit ribosomal protein L21
MNAIVKISGKQFKVEKDTKLFVNRLDAKEGERVTFDNVLLLDNGSKVVVGKPSVKDAIVEAKVLKHLKDDKVIVFKKKRRKGYKVKNGHRQPITEIIIQAISEKKVAPKKEAEASKKTTAAKK